MISGIFLSNIFYTKTKNCIYSKATRRHINWHLFFNIPSKQFMKAAQTISHRRLIQLHRDHRESARAASLLYVTDSKPGITRVKQGKGYRYIWQGKTLRNKKELERIRQLAIPPSWTNVWICPVADGHIQATGSDMNGRKQYRYHADWHRLRTDTKFHRLFEFGKTLSRLRRKVRKDMMSRGLTEEKVIATIIDLMEKTYVRIGNNGYEKLYGSYGLTTLKDRHVTVGSEKISLTFTGKKGIEHAISIRDRRLARIIKQCRDIPGKELFQYYTPEGDRKCIDSGMVNNYIKTATGDAFTAKDFRTWAGSLHALQVLKKLGCPDSDTQLRKNIIIVFEEVSKKLGNSRNICKKYYVHPCLIQLYEEGKLDAMLAGTLSTAFRGLNSEEKLLMQVIKKSIAKA